MITFIDSERDTIEAYHESRDDTIRFRGTPFITRNNAAQLWPAFKHFAETGEPVEAPEEMDCSIPISELTPRKKDSDTYRYTVRMLNDVTAIAHGAKLWIIDSDYQVLDQQGLITFIAPRGSVLFIVRDDSVKDN